MIHLSMTVDEDVGDGSSLWSICRSVVKLKTCFLMFFNFYYRVYGF